MSSVSENKVDSIVNEIIAMGTDTIKNIYRKHGAVEPFYGVKVEDLKKILKREKHNHELALALYDSGVSDAMYLAGLMADGSRMSKEQLQKWVDNATWYMMSEYPVAWVTSESEYAFELAMEWIDSARELTATAGWCTLSALAGTRDDSQLDVNAYSKLIDRVEKTIHKSPNRVRYCMNGFLISTGAGIASLKEKAMQAAARIGKVTVNLGDTACKVPDAKEYISKIEQKGMIGKKRKTAKC